MTQIGLFWKEHINVDYGKFDAVAAFTNTEDIDTKDERFKDHRKAAWLAGKPFLAMVNVPIHQLMVDSLDDLETKIIVPGTAFIKMLDDRLADKQTNRQIHGVILSIDYDEKVTGNWVANVSKYLKFFVEERYHIPAFIMVPANIALDYPDPAKNPRVWLDKTSKISLKYGASWIERPTVEFWWNNSDASVKPTAGLITYNGTPAQLYALLNFTAPVPETPVEDEPPTETGLDEQIDELFAFMQMTNLDLVHTDERVRCIKDKCYEIEAKLDTIITMLTPGLADNARINGKQ